MINIFKNKKLQKQIIIIGASFVLLTVLGITSYSLLQKNKDGENNSPNPPSEPGSTFNFNPYLQSFARGSWDQLLIGDPATVGKGLFNKVNNSGNKTNFDALLETVQFDYHEAFGMTKTQWESQYQIVVNKLYEFKANNYSEITDAVVFNALQDKGFKENWTVVYSKKNATTPEGGFITIEVQRDGEMTINELYERIDYNFGNLAYTEKEEQQKNFSSVWKDQGLDAKNSMIETIFFTKVNAKLNLNPTKATQMLKGKNKTEKFNKDAFKDDNWSNITKIITDNTKSIDKLEYSSDNGATWKAIDADFWTENVFNSDHKKYELVAVKNLGFKLTIDNAVKYFTFSGSIFASTNQSNPVKGEYEWNPNA